MKKYAIIVAGGSGTRMKSTIPKQFLFVDNQPIIAMTINQFLKAGCEVIVVLPSMFLSTFETEILLHCDNQDLLLVEGGDTRFQSVKNGLEHVDDESLVAVHDAVRPFIKIETINNSFEEAKLKNNAVTSIVLKDSIRLLTNNGSESKDRAMYRLIQTPQTFDGKLLKKAYKQEFTTSFTDDASVFEADGNTIHLIDGDFKNIKITTPEDLLIAKAFTE